MERCTGTRLISRQYTPLSIGFKTVSQNTRPQKARHPSRKLRRQTVSFFASRIISWGASRIARRGTFLGSRRGRPSSAHVAGRAAFVPQVVPWAALRGSRRGAHRRLRRGRIAVSTQSYRNHPVKHAVVCSSRLHHKLHRRLRRLRGGTCAICATLPSVARAIGCIATCAAGRAALVPQVAQRVASVRAAHQVLRPV